VANPTLKWVLNMDGKTEGSDESKTSFKLTINLIDVVEPPKLAVGQERFIGESSAVGTAVTAASGGAALEVTDPEGDGITWSIVTGNDGGAMTIDTSGLLRVAKAGVLD